MPTLFEIFNLSILALSVIVLVRYHTDLSKLDVVLVTTIGIIIGVTITFTSFYPLVPLSNGILVSIGHGTSLAIIFAAGLIIARQGGPIQLSLARDDVKESGSGILIGLLIGVPFAIINALALSLMQGQPFVMQDYFLSGIGALQPGLVEEVVYRLALLNMIWALMRVYVPEKAVMLAATLALLIHNYAHLTDLFVIQPLFAIMYGGIIGLLFGLPMTILAVKRNLESSIAFHWIVDFVRFLGGF
jgi:hypothetical protein